VLTALLLCLAFIALLMGTALASRVGLIWLGGAAAILFTLGLRSILQRDKDVNP
jgi:hypothetical protein